MPPSPVDLLFQILVYEQGKETGEEVSLDAVVPPNVDRPGIKVGLHDAEAVFYDPSAAVQSDDVRCRILKVSAQGIEAVEAGLLVYHLLIERVAFYLRELAVHGAVLSLDEALGIIRTLALGGHTLPFLQQGDRTAHLPFAHIREIRLVLE